MPATEILVAAATNAAVQGLHLWFEWMRIQGRTQEEMDAEYARQKALALGENAPHNLPRVPEGGD